MNRKTITQGVFATVLLLVLLAGYAAWFAAVQASTTRAEELKEQIQTKSDATTRIAQARSALGALTKSEADVQQHYVSTNDVVAFLGGLQAQGQTLGSTVDVISVSAENGSTHNELSLSLKITGPFSSVMRTLGAIEYSPYDIRVIDLTLDTPVSENASSSPWTVTGLFSVATLERATTTTQK